MSNVMRPDDDPALAGREVREMMWALEFAAARPVDAATAAKVWRDVRERRGATARVRDAVDRGLRQVVAMLVPESLAFSTAVRSGEGANPRLLVYETDQFTVSLAFDSPPESAVVALTGQVVPRVSQHLPAGGVVRVWNASGTAETALNEYGEFSLRSLRHGDLHMDIILGGDNIQISPIHTRAAREREG